MTTTHADPFDILDFWWSAGAMKWFARDDGFDAEIRERFGEINAVAARGGFDGWAETPHGSLALILVLDQFSRNLFQNDAHGFHRAFLREARTFFFLPFEHAEDMAAQEMSVNLFRQNGEQTTYLYALIHMDVIRRFGRFLHRNDVLSRTITQPERDYLATGGFST
ncbi:MAG: DUF924 family protein [Breoghania sp.]|nr:DUF924 family protein [Breoghania sp.]